MEQRRFAISYARALLPLFTLLGMGPRRSAVTLAGDDVLVGLGLGFQARFPRAAVRSVQPFTGTVAGWGAHGWRGRWLVNASSRGIVTLELAPPQAARVLGVPVRLEVLRVGLEDPEAFLEAFLPRGAPRRWPPRSSAR